MPACGRQSRGGGSSSSTTVVVVIPRSRNSCAYTPGGSQPACWSTRIAGSGGRVRCDCTDPILGGGSDDQVPGSVQRRHLGAGADGPGDPRAATGGHGGMDGVGPEGWP